MFLFMNFHHVLPVALMVIVISRGCLLHFIENLCYVCVYLFLFFYSCATVAYSEPVLEVHLLKLTGFV